MRLRSWLLHDTQFTHKLQCANLQLAIVELVEVWGTAVQAVKAFQCQEMQLSLSQEQVARIEFHGVCLQSVGWHESSCSLFPALQSMAYTHTISLHHLVAVMGLHRLPKTGDSLDGKGGFKSLLMVLTGKGEWQMVQSTSPVPIGVAMIHASILTWKP